MRNIAKQPLLSAVMIVCLTACLSGADWLQFRGTNNDGVSAEKSLPTNWSENITWKVPLPGRGTCGPIVIGDRLILTASSGVNQDRLHVICFDTRGGERLWERQAWATGRTFCHPSMGVAAPTPASDGKRVYAFYSSNDLICLDMDGNLQWFRGLAHDYPKAGNDIGMASSPVILGDTVIVQIECQGDSFAMGLDAATGETRWRHTREARANWASPTVLRGRTRADDVVLLQSPSGLTAHEPTSGKQLWQFKEGCSGTSSPVAAGGTVYVPSGGVTALQPGDSVTPEIRWAENRLSPSSASPVIYDGHIYTLNRAGVLACGSLEDGKVLWQLRLKGRFWATPVAVGKYLHLVNADGLAQVVSLGVKGKLAESSELGEKIQGTPAVASGALYVRSDGHLWKIAEK